MRGDIIVAIPITAAIKGQSIALSAGTPQISPQGVYAVGFVPVPERNVENAVRTVVPKINRTLATINAWIRKQLFTSTMQTQMKVLNLKIQSVRLDSRGGSLTVTVLLAGQVAAATVNKWFGSI